MDVERARAYVRENVDRWVAGVQRLVRQPSISAQHVGILETAALIRQEMERVGAHVCEERVGDGHPILYGEIDAGQSQTVLIYGHYDVQPPDPLAEWTHDPFGGEVADGAIYGRGAADEKGEFFSRLAAVEAYPASGCPLPVNVKFLVEGEEEIGSPSLEAYVRRHADRLRADAGIWEGGFKQRNGRIDLSFGNRGICYVELRCRGMKTDLHSGRGGLVTQPAWRLLHALATMRDQDGRVQIAGFYDEVKPPTAYEDTLLRENPLDEDAYREQLGITQFARGLVGLDLQREHLFQPTFTICGMLAGYTGRGMKTVVPREATVKLDCRLVPDMDPRRTFERIQAHLHRHGFDDVEATLVSATPPGQTSLQDRFVTVVAGAARTVYGVDPELRPRFGGSTPMYVFNKLLGVPTVAGVGVRWYGCNYHAPNENIRIEDFVQGTEHLVQIFWDLAQRP